MASSYSTSLKIQLIGSGEQSGVWGSSSNTNWNLIEQAVAGVTTITMANANYTLSNLNGVSDEARSMVIVAAGTNSAVRQIVAPLVPKFYVVSNQTSGGFAVTIGGGTGAVVSIPNGTVGQVYCDGTAFYSAQTGSAGNFNVNGTLTVGSIVDSGTMSATTITASTQFSGPGTGLTGTGASFTAGNATTAATANALNASNSYSVNSITASGTLTTVGLTVGNGQAASTIVMSDSDEGNRSIHNNSNQIGFLTQAGGWGAYCDDSGNWTAAGNVTAYSDERLKKNWQDLPVDFIERLSQIKSGTYERVDREEKQHGVSAQSLQTLLPYAVGANNDGFLSVAYGNAALVSVIELAKEVMALKEEIKQLKGA